MNINIVEQKELKDGAFWVSYFGNDKYFEVGNDDKDISGEFFPDRNNQSCLTLTDWSGEYPKEICQNHCFGVPFTSNPRSALALLKKYFKAKF